MRPAHPTIPILTTFLPQWTACGCHQ